MDIFILLSLTLFLMGLFLYIKKGRKNFFSIIFFVIVYLIALVGYLFYFVSDYFTGEGITSTVLDTLQFGLVGAGFLEYKSLIVTLFVIIFFSLAFLFSILFLKNVEGNKKLYGYLSLFFLYTSLLVNPSTETFLDVFFQENQTQVAIVQASQIEISPTSTIENIPKTDFDTLYRVPHIEQIKPNKNLIFIYLEGLEQTYSNEQIFPQLTQGLNDLESKNIYFSNLNQSTYGAEYTIAGIVSSQCGMPLVSPSHGNTLFGMDTFLQGATCLGDLLSSEDYYLAYYGGASLDFAAKGKFYQTHSFDEVKGREELLPTLEDPNYKNGWGLFDDSLFDIVYNRFEELSETKDKFALFMLTVDSHHPNGQTSKSCDGMPYQDGKNSMLNAVYCSDYLVSNFVKKVQASAYAEDVVIVIASDHLGIKNTASDLLKKTKRTNRLIIVDPENKSGKKVIDTWGTTLDTGATILPFIGYQADLGLGRDLNSKSYVMDDSVYIYSHLKDWRDRFYSFFDFPKIRTGLKIDLEKEEIQIDNRKFLMPALIEVNENLETLFKFRFNISQEYQLSSYIEDYDNEKSFLLFDYCDDVRKFDPELAEDVKYCLMAGKKDHYVTAPIIGDMILNREEILSILSLSK